MSAPSPKKPAAALPKKVAAVLPKRPEDAARKEPAVVAEGPRYQPLVPVLAALAAGVLADRELGWPVAAWWAIVVGVWIAWLLLWRRRWHGPAAVAILASVAACGAGWHHCCWSLFADDDLGCYAAARPQPVCLRAVAMKSPWRIPAPPPSPLDAVPEYDRTRIELRVTEIRDGARWQPVAGRTALTVDGHLLGVHAGDQVQVFGQLAIARRPQNPGEFDYAQYHRGDRRLALLSAEFPDCVTVLRPAGAWGPRTWIESLRAEGDRLLWQYVAERRAGLAAAILLGVREEVSQDRTEAFMVTGTIHVLSISGLHVGLLAVSLLFLLRLAAVRRRRSLALVAAAVVAYTLLADAQPPAVRSTILVLVACAAAYLGRQPLRFNALAAAGVLVLAMNPADLFRSGVQLSFLCVAGIIWFGPRVLAWTTTRSAIERLAAESRPWWQRASLSAARSVAQFALISSVIWLLTLPSVMAQFHVFSPVALVLNTLLGLPMAVALVSGFGVLVLGWLAPPLACVCGWCCDGALWLLEAGVSLGREFPGSYFWVPGPAPWWLWVFYGGLGVLAAFPAVRPPWRWCLALLAGWCAVGFAVSLWQRPHGRLDCTFLSVGHGSAVVLELPDGRTVLYDGGRSLSPHTGARSIAGFLWSRGVVHLDAVIVSHPDADHYNALPDLVERFSVGVIYVSPLMFAEPDPGLDELLRSVQEAGIPLREMYAGDRLRGEGWQVEVLHPPRRGVPGGDNANSIVLAVEYLGRRLLLPGDLETPGLERITAEEPWDCDVLLAPHHGSRLSDPPGLAAWCTPEWVVISGGFRYDLGETTRAYRQSGSWVLHCGSLGAVHVGIDRSGIEVDNFLKSIQFATPESPGR